MDYWSSFLFMCVLHVACTSVCVCLCVLCVCVCVVCSTILSSSNPLWHMHCHCWLACQRENIYCQEARQIFEVDRIKHKRQDYAIICLVYYACSITFSVFNVGEYRRNQVGADKPHDFFHPDNQEGLLQRK